MLHHLPLLIWTLGIECRTTMGGEAHVLRISTSECSGFELRQLQSFKDHQKQVGSVGPVGFAGGCSMLQPERPIEHEIFTRSHKFFRLRWLDVLWC
jgi:hypothetical protein